MLNIKNITQNYCIFGTCR